jgi:hypothetical protein
VKFCRRAQKRDQRLIANLPIRFPKRKADAMLYIRAIAIGSAWRDRNGTGLSNPTRHDQDEVSEPALI